MRLRELSDILSAYLLLSFSFAAIFAREAWFKAPYSVEAFHALVTPFKFALVTLGISFVIHEMAHRGIARKWGAHAEFRASWIGLAVSIIVTTLLGFVIAFPGAVVVTNLPPGKIGRVALAGPLSNLLLIPLFLSLSVLGGEWLVVSIYGVIINSVLAFFNLMPIRGLDGGHVWEWNKLISVGLLLASLGVFYWAVTTYVG